MNWDRQYSMMCGVAGQNGFEIGNSTNGRPLHINFEIEKSDTRSANTGTIKVTNLSEENKAILEQKNCVVELRAGYSDSIGPIFLGGVSNITETRQGADTDTEIEVIDGLTTYDQIGSLSYTGVVTCYTIVENLRMMMGFTSETITTLALQQLILSKYDFGYSFVGRLTHALKAVCEKAGVKYSIQNSILQVYLDGEPITTKAYVIGPKSGLISIPKKITITKDGQVQDASKAEKKESKKGKKTVSTNNAITGYEIEYLINPAIAINDMISIDSKSLQGFFRVQKQKYKGDNYSGDWKCTADVVEVLA